MEYTEQQKQIYNDVCDKYKHNWLNTTISQTMAMEMISKALSVSKSLQADIRNKLSPLSNLIAMLEDGADDEWLEKQVVECKKSIEYLSNVC
jgi:hypothetical protein